MKKMENSLIIGENFFFFAKSAFITVEMTFNHKNDQKGNNNHCYEQFLWKNI